MQHRSVKVAAVIVATSFTAFGQEFKDINDVDLTSKLLAGIAVPGTSEITSTDGWKAHRRSMNSTWRRYKKSNLAPMRVWSANKFPGTSGKGEVIRYPFSGPDILHAMHMFPDAETYILCGLEPVGNIPTSEILRGVDSTKSLEEIRKILEESLRFSFFKTKDMKAELASSRYRGTLPIMCLFLSGSGLNITGVEFIKLHTDGSISNLDKNTETADAVRIKASSANEKCKSIYYFRTNIANGSISQSGFLKHLESLPKGRSYIKAASYLMHKNYFSQVRNHLLSHSTFIVQDDSGIPLNHFAPLSWELTYYGSYIEPIDLFKDHSQPDLRAAFKEDSKYLPFGTGYRWRKGQSNLIVANKIDSPKAPRATLVVQEAVPVKKQNSELPDFVSESKTLDLTLELLAKSEINEQIIASKNNAFIVNEYLILSVNKGPEELTGKRIRVVATRLFQGSLLPSRIIGIHITLKLEPLSNYPSLLNWHIEDDLPESSKTTLYIASQS